MARQIQGSQWDFSFGEVDVNLKRSDSHPARKAGLRQMVNARIYNSGGLSNRSGRRALYPNNTLCTRIEEITMSAGNIFKLAFGPQKVEVRNSVGVVVASFTVTGGGSGLPWLTSADIKNVVYAIKDLSIYFTFAGMRPQVVTWDGVSTWTIKDFTEILNGNQKRTPFYRLSPQGITIQPSAQSGAVNLVASGNVFTPAHVGTRIRFVNRQILITGYFTPQLAIGVVAEPLPGAQGIVFAIDPTATFSVGDVVIASGSGSKGLVISINVPSKTLVVQLLTTSTSNPVTAAAGFGGASSSTYALSTYAFLGTDLVVGPSGSLQATSATPIAPPQPCSLWDDEVINNMRGYPASCFADQFRVGFCDFPAIPGGIAWSAINAPTDLYVGANPSDAMFEIAPSKVRVRYVVPGPESSEFVFADTRIYYIPISPTNPLKPGSVQFQILSGDGSARVQPRLAQEAILYVNAGESSVMAIIATGAYLRPFNTKSLTSFHNHLFNDIQAIAAPNADGTFEERYAYILNGNGSIVVGKYDADSLAGNAPVIGWGPWSGSGTVTWIAAHSADVIFTTNYFGTSICEILDDAQYLDCTLPVNAAPAAFTPPGGKGPMWFIPSQSVTLIDQGTRFMGTYQIDANGFIVPQFNGGEDLTIASLVAGQPWTMTVEPFPPDATSGADMGQRMKMRQISRIVAAVLNSTGIMFASLFCSAQTSTSPPLGTIMNTKRFPAWNVDDIVTAPPPLRETVHEWTPAGASFDPRVAIIHDTPGPLTIVEIGMEISL